MAMGDEYVEHADLSALKVIGSVGEPINAEAWHWYYQKVGHGNCPIVDTWWQTETGGIMISGLGAHSPQRPTYAGRPLPGIQPVLLDGDGNEITGDGVEGYLCVKHPWPAMLRTTCSDHSVVETYISVTMRAITSQVTAHVVRTVCSASLVVWMMSSTSADIDSVLRKLRMPSMLFSSHRKCCSGLPARYQGRHLCLCDPRRRRSQQTSCDKCSLEYGCERNWSHCKTRCHTDCTWFTKNTIGKNHAENTSKSR